MMRGLFLLLVSLLPMAASAQSPEKLRQYADPAALRASVDAGRKVTQFCANCHGEEGIAKIPEVPNLAGQHPAYLFEQIRKFANGERKDPFMQGLIKVLKEEERAQAATYFASQRVTPGKADPALAEQGKKTYQKLCMRCHGEQGYGNEKTPRLAGQHIPYLKLSITRYRDGTGIRNEPLMQIATATLKNEEILALAHYLTQLP